MEDETQSTFLKYLEIQNLETCTGGTVVKKDVNKPGKLKSVYMC